MSTKSNSISNTNFDQLQGLLDLAKSKNLAEGNFEKFIQESLLNLSNNLKISQTSFWIWSESDESIVNMAMYSNKDSKFTYGQNLCKKDYPQYFKSFQNNLLINASDAELDTRTNELLKSYLLPNKIHSMLDIQVMVESKLFGIICLEQIDEKRIWNKGEELYVSTVAAYFSQCYINKLKQAEAKKSILHETNFRSLFINSPIPMWVYDPDSFKFLTVNTSAVKEYGYTKKEFSKMTILDIRPLNEKDLLIKHLKDVGHQQWMSTKWLHQYKDGTIINVEIASDWTIYNGKKVRLVIALNKTKEVALFKEKEEYISKLSDYAFYASHNLRGPVASILGLIRIIDIDWENRKTYKEAIEGLKKSAKQLDDIISTLNDKINI